MNDLNQSIAMNQNTTSTRNHSNEEKSNSHENEPNSITDHDQADGWLDDVELGNLSPNDFDNVMDQYLTTVIRQLVHLAIDDADLNQELNSLDSNGFSLLHYCCLYNLTDLISLLLNNGAHINQLTACGSSPLHLAVGEICDLSYGLI
jgi:ankyrin repeat protein